MNVFYFPDLSSDIITLDEEESKHAVRVLRLKNGDAVELVDGKGTRATAEVSDDHPKRCALQVTERKVETTGRNFRLHIAIAPTKNIDRLEWFVEKAVETGIDAITLLSCGHSERLTVKLQRLGKVAVSGMKQSQQSWLPELNDVVPFGDFVSSVSPGAQRFIAHCDEGEKSHLKNLLQPGGEVVVLIGPEGDFSPGEIATATAAGFRAVSLGETRLRTETAALVAALTVQLGNV